MLLILDVIKLAWAVAIHKSQGLTLDKVVIDAGEREFSSRLTFVACSRVRKILMNFFKYKNIVEKRHFVNIFLVIIHAEVEHFCIFYQSTPIGFPACSRVNEGGTQIENSGSCHQTSSQITDFQGRTF